MLNLNFFLDFICGDKCLQYGKEDHKPYCAKEGYEWESVDCQRLDWLFQHPSSKTICQCGQLTMTIEDLNRVKSYCCSPDWPCQDQGNKIVCQNGTVVKQNNKCANECPTAGIVSAIAIATKEACDLEHKCYQNKENSYDFNEICDLNQIDGKQFAGKFCGSNGYSEPCFNNVTTGIHKIGQCYSKDFIG